MCCWQLRDKPDNQVCVASGSQLSRLPCQTPALCNALFNFHFDALFRSATHNYSIYFSAGVTPRVSILATSHQSIVFRRLPLLPILIFWSAAALPPLLIRNAHHENKLHRRTNPLNRKPTPKRFFQPHYCCHPPPNTL